MHGAALDQSQNTLPDDALDCGHVVLVQLGRWVETQIPVFVLTIQAIVSRLGWATRSIRAQAIRQALGIDCLSEVPRLLLSCPFVDRFNSDHCGMGKMAFLMVA